MFSNDYKTFRNKEWLCFCNHADIPVASWDNQILQIIGFIAQKKMLWQRRITSFFVFKRGVLLFFLFRGPFNCRGKTFALLNTDTVGSVRFGFLWKGKLCSRLARKELPDAWQAPVPFCALLQTFFVTSILSGLYWHLLYYQKILLCGT